MEHNKEYATLAFAPHTRGWSLPHRMRRTQEELCPAHAGMVPSTPPPLSGCTSLPRTRGDGPCACFSPITYKTFAPHTQGWSRGVHILLKTRFLCPAHAGMVPARWAWGRPPASLPRTRGDGPASISKGSTACSFAPHTRGWSGTSGAVFCFGELCFIRGGMQ